MEFQQGKGPVMPCFTAQVTKVLPMGLPLGMWGRNVCSLNWLELVSNGREHLTSKMFHKNVSLIFILKKIYNLTFYAANSIKSQ